MTQMDPTGKLRHGPQLFIIPVEWKQLVYIQVAASNSVHKIEGVSAGLAGG